MKIFAKLYNLMKTTGNKYNNGKFSGLSKNKGLNFKLMFGNISIQTFL